MTQSAEEIITVQLARAAGTPAYRFLRARGLQPADCDDVIAAAQLWCLENRDSYSLTTTLETWFMNAVRDAYKKFKSDELPTSDEDVESIAGVDDTYQNAAAQSAAEALVRALVPADREIALLTMRGYTQGEMMARGIPHHEIQSARARIKQLRRLVTDEEARRLVIRAQPRSSDDADDKVTGIDAELERLEAPPSHGKECKPCIHCDWWAFRYQEAKSPQVEATASEEIRAAQRAILARKIEISSKVEHAQ
jgi:hypothetical protein